ncbi:MAG: gfo/Idh/MocA family oxidoreductase, partial [Spirochaetales bacterium]
STPLYKQLYHDGTHLIDCISFLTGNPLQTPQVKGNLYRKKGTSYIFTRTRVNMHKDQTVRENTDSDNTISVPVCIEVGAERNHLVFELSLSFSKGRIEIGNGVYREQESRESPFYKGYRSLLPRETPSFSQTGYFRNMMADAVACVLEPGHQPVSSAKDGAEALRFIFKVVPKLLERR